MGKILSGQEILRLAIRQGWKARWGRGTHVVLYTPCGKHSMIVSVSKKNHRRTDANDTKRAVRYGLRLEQT